MRMSEGEVKRVRLVPPHARGHLSYTEKVVFEFHSFLIQRQYLSYIEVSLHVENIGQ